MTTPTENFTQRRLKRRNLISLKSTVQIDGFAMINESRIGAKGIGIGKG